jgi:response regulator RpfG family c-di-GMP phosphodiesterase
VSQVVFVRRSTVTNRINEHIADYATDYIKIKELALKEKQIKAIGKWFDETIKNTYVKVLVEYRDCDFTNNWKNNFIFFIKLKRVSFMNS